MDILSIYTHLFEKNCRYFLYNAEVCYFSEITQEFFNILKNGDFGKLPKDVLSEIKEKKIVIDESKKYDYYYNAQIAYNKSAYADSFLGLIIVPTTGCNFACPYCFEPKNNPKTMTSEVIDNIIKYINENRGLKRIAITWYGGEPLLGISSMKELYSKIKQETKVDIFSSTIVTNGYLIDDNVIEFFKKSNLASIQITLDGVEEHHNRTRVLKGGAKNTYKRILCNLKKLAQSMPNLNISLRININKNNAMDLVELFKYFQTEKWQDNIYVYPGFIREDTADKRSLCDNCYTTDEFINLYEEFQKHGVPVNFLPRLKPQRGCMIQTSNTLIIGPEGEIYKCWNDVSDESKVVGNLVDASIFNDDLYLKYMSQVNPFDKECKDCSVFPICDGGCGHWRYRNKFEDGQFNYCTTFKVKENLERALLLSLEYKIDEKKKHLFV